MIKAWKRKIEITKNVKGLTCRHAVQLVSRDPENQLAGNSASILATQKKKASNFVPSVVSIGRLENQIQYMHACAFPRTQVST